MLQLCCSFGVHEGDVREEPLRGRSSPSPVGKRARSTWAAATSEVLIPQAQLRLCSPLAHAHPGQRQENFDAFEYELDRWLATAHQESQHGRGPTAESILCPSADTAPK